MSHLAENQTISLTAEQRRYLSGPIVLHNPGWADNLPEWLTAAIPAASDAVRLPRTYTSLAGSLPTRTTVSPGRGPPSSRSAATPPATSARTSAASAFPSRISPISRHPDV